VLQTIFFIVSCVLPPYIEKDFEPTSYHYYNLGCLIFLLGAQFYFLNYAVKKNSPSDLLSFILLAAMYNFYLIFRDIVYWHWP
jgi:hypothetical protein